MQLDTATTCCTAGFRNQPGQLTISLAMSPNSIMSAPHDGLHPGILTVAPVLRESVRPGMNPAGSERVRDSAGFPERRQTPCDGPQTITRSLTAAVASEQARISAGTKCFAVNESQQQIPHSPAIFQIPAHNFGDFLPLRKVQNASCGPCQQLFGQTAAEPVDVLHQP